MKKKGFTLVEMLAVIVILGIVIGLAVAAYSKYVTSSRNKSYTIAENSLKTSAGDAIIDCLTGEGKNREFCKNHDLVENQYEYELVYLKELVNDDYMDSIRDPYNTDLLCSEDSYVYITNKADTNQVNNADLDYKVCLICSNYRSKDCLEDVENNDRNYNAYCKVTYSDGSVYGGEWTDKDLKLTLTADGEYKYGISYFNYSYEGVSKKVQAKDNKAEVILDSTVDSKNIKVTAVDGMNGVSNLSKCDETVKLDKEKLISAKITGVLKDKQTKITSNSWSNENVVLTVTTNPKQIPSGATYTWYRNGVKINGENQKTYVAKEDGIYYAEVTNGVGNQKIKTSEFITKIDTESPKVLYSITEGSKLISDSEWYTSSKVILNVKIIDQVNVLDKNGSITLSEGGSGVNPSSVKIVSDNNNAVIKKVSDTEYNIEMTTNGTYNITTTASDNLNNTSVEYKYTIKKDDVQPTITAKAISHVTYNSSENVTNYFNLSSYGVAGGKTTCYCNGNAITNNNQLALGINTVSCKMVATNGKTAEASVVVKHKYNASTKCSGGRSLSSGNCTYHYSSDCGQCGDSCSGYYDQCQSCTKTRKKTCTGTKQVCSSTYACGCSYQCWQEPDRWGSGYTYTCGDKCTKTCCNYTNQTYTYECEETYTDSCCSTKKVCSGYKCDSCTKTENSYRYYQCESTGNNGSKGSLSGTVCYF